MLLTAHRDCLHVRRALAPAKRLGEGAPPLARIGLAGATEPSHVVTGTTGCDYGSGIAVDDQDLGGLS